MVFPSDGVGIGFGTEGCRVGHITGYRRYCRCPAAVGVCVLIRCVLRRCLAIIGRHGAIGHIFVRFQNGAVMVLPGDSVGIHRGAEGCRISHIASYRRNRRCPSTVRVGVLDSCCFCRRYTVVGRHGAIGYIGIGFQYRAVVVLPGNGEGFDRGVCSIGDIAADRSDGILQHSCYLYVTGSLRPVLPGVSGRDSCIDLNGRTCVVGIGFAAHCSTTDDGLRNGTNTSALRQGHSILLTIDIDLLGLCSGNSITCNACRLIGSICRTTPARECCTVIVILAHN